jgi:4'-phosphopantetheinyl transferase
MGWVITEPHLHHRSAPAMDDFVRVCTDPADFPGHALSWASDFGEDDGPELRILPSINASTGMPPQPNEIWLWLATPAPHIGGNALDDDDGSAGFLPLLNDAERDRLGKFHFARDRWSFGAAHAGLRALLSTILDVASPRIELVLSSHGKPSLSRDYFGSALADALQFNISHTRGMVAVAVSGRPVGVDVEPMRPLSEMRQLVVDLMAPEAVAAFDAATSPSERLDLFFRFWSLGEAFIKATGLGLQQGLDSFAFTATGEPHLTRVTPGWGDVGRWRLGHASSGRGGRDWKPAERPPLAAALAS